MQYIYIIETVMALKVLVVAATDAEAGALKKIPGIKPVSQAYLLGGCEISLLVTGVGSMETSWAMNKWFSANTKPDLALNIGIAGSYNENIRIGDVVLPVSDCFADAGVEAGDGFSTLWEAGLTDPDTFPFSGGRIRSGNSFVNLAASFLRTVNAITVNCATGSEVTKERLQKKFNPDIETMEGATFFYICSGETLPFLAFRAISNKVEKRDTTRWNIPLALRNMSEKLGEFLLKI